jgi:hypothetical protein
VRGNEHEPGDGYEAKTEHEHEQQGRKRKKENTIIEWGDDGDDNENEKDNK